MRKVFGAFDVRSFWQRKNALNEFCYILKKIPPPMHEVSVMADLITAIIKELEKYDVVSVKGVKMTVGKLTNLGGEQLVFAYDIMTKDSVLEGSELVITEEEIEVQCGKCGYAGPVKNMEAEEESHLSIPILSCPECGGAVTITAGKTCRVTSIEIEEAD
jgi:hydrogenase nickel incorporation protein HypA/HybF